LVDAACLQADLEVVAQPVRRPLSDKPLCICPGFEQPWGGTFSDLAHDDGLCLGCQRNDPFVAGLGGPAFLGLRRELFADQDGYRLGTFVAHDGGSHQRFLEINKAYAALRNPESRKAYDAARAARNGPRA
jgi:hypothetical protein